MTNVYHSTYSSSVFCASSLFVCFKLNSDAEVGDCTVGDKLRVSVYAILSSLTEKF